MTIDIKKALGPGRVNLLIVINQCETMEELTEVWNLLFEDERKAFKQYFTKRKKKIS